MNLEKPTSKKGQSTSRDNSSAARTSRKKSAFGKTLRQNSQSSKSIVNSIDNKLKTNGSDCGSAKKIKSQKRDPVFRNIKTKVVVGNKENKQETVPTGQS